MRKAVRKKGSEAEIRIGADLIQTNVVRDSIDRFGSRYLERIYTPAEIEYCQRSEAEKCRRFAARFAAKEATLKVLRPDQHWLDWRCIEVLKMPGGWCEISLHGPAALLAETVGVSALSVSISHEDSYALATVVATVHKPR